MSYVDRVKTAIDSLDLGEPIFKTSVRENAIMVTEQAWKSDLDNSDLVNYMVNRYGTRVYDPKKKEFYIDMIYLLKSIDHHIFNNVLDMFVQCSHYNSPRRTNAYKGFRDTVDRNKSNEEFKKQIFDIYEYYINSTSTDPIKHPDNDVHRKNIYHLLCLMEKSYGKNGKSNNF